MARVFRCPSEFPPPAWKADASTNWQKVEDDYIASLAAVARARVPDDDLVGEVVRFPIGDGHAQYMVWSTAPLQLIWLELGDAYSIPAAMARGLRIADIRAQVQGRKSMPPFVPLWRSAAA